MTTLLAACLASCLTACFSAVATGTDHDPLITHHAIEVSGRSYPYAVYRSPHLENDAEAPMIVFLHGSGECGTDGLKPLAVGLMPAVFLQSKRWPAVILVPQKPTRWSEWEDHELAVLAMIDRVAETERVDPDRIALTGLSQGGHGAFMLGYRNPALFCAVAPVCGYVAYDGDGQSRVWPESAEDPRVSAIVEGLWETPVWAVHGEADPIVPITQSLLVMDRLAQREDASLTTMSALPGVGHNAWDHAYRSTALAEWLLADRSGD